jgi:DNA-binding MarR family transcriptional regulator
VSAGGSVSVALTTAQVERVLQQTGARDGEPAALFDRLGDLQSLSRLVASGLDDPRVSHSTLRAMLVLAALPRDGTERSLTEVAETLGYSPSTTYRYMTTWMRLGLLEQEPSSRRYRRATA